MKIDEAITILKRHNEWRRGADIPMEDVTVLGEAIDTVVDHFSNDTKIVWHKVADGDLPEDGQHILYALKVPYGFYYETIYYPEPPLTDEIDYWMDIPEINIKDNGINANYEKVNTNLTWQDIRRIVQIADEIINDGYKDSHGVLWDEEGYYKDVLKIFKDE